jgi:hypothetical protein
MLSPALPKMLEASCLCTALRPCNSGHAEFKFFTFYCTKRCVSVSMAIAIAIAIATIQYRCWN